MMMSMKDIFDTSQVSYLVNRRVGHVSAVAQIDKELTRLGHEVGEPVTLHIRLGGVEAKLLALVAEEEDLSSVQLIRRLVRAHLELD